MQLSEVTQASSFLSRLQCLDAAFHSCSQFVRPNLTAPFNSRSTKKKFQTGSLDDVSEEFGKKSLKKYYNLFCALFRT